MMKSFLSWYHSFPLKPEILQLGFFYSNIFDICMLLRADSVKRAQEQRKLTTVTELLTLLRTFVDGLTLKKRIKSY